MKIRSDIAKKMVTYASSVLALPLDGVDCYEGCNPYGFPPEIFETVRHFDFASVAPYPHNQSLFDAIRTYWKDQYELKQENLFLADGSISALYAVDALFADPEARVLGVAPQFSDQGMYLALCGMKYETVTLQRQQNYQIDVNEILSRMDGGLSMVYIDNPNNPTGQVLADVDLERILKKAEMLGIAVVVDEAYGDLMPKDKAAIRFLETYENLIIVRSFSKGFGLAGVRCGYVIAHESVIDYLNNIRNPYQVNTFSREMACAALKHGNFLETSMQQFSDAKRRIRAVVGKTLHMAETCDTVSIALLYHEDADVDLQKMLLDRGILCVSGNDFAGIDRSSVRIRVPKTEEVHRLLCALSEINRGM